MSPSSPTLLALPDLAAGLAAFQPSQIQLYLITRQVRPDLPRRTKAFDRYVFTPYRVDVDAPLQEYLLERVDYEMQRVIQKDRQLLPFDVTPDDEDGEAVFATPRTGDIGGFQPLLSALSASTEVRLLQTNLREVLPEVWAYCIRFQPDSVDEPPFYCFQRYAQSRIVQPEKRSLRTLLIRTTNTVELALVQEQTMSLDCKVDCVFHDEQFYILSKKGFEEIAGLDEQYQERATQFVTTLTSSGHFVGLEHLTQLCSEKGAMRKKLARFAQNGAHHIISAERKGKMLEVASKYGFTLYVDEEGRIMVDSSRDAELVIKLLDSYFLLCEQTGDPYGSFTKRRLQQSTG